MIQARWKSLPGVPALSVARHFRRIGWSAVVATLCACANPLDATPEPSAPAAAVLASPSPSVMPAPASSDLPSATRLPEIRPELTASESLSSVPESAPPSDAEGEVIERGRATWYGRKFHGKRTASGELFDMHELTAAHKTLPFGTLVRVRSLRNGREVVVRINDRGPFTKGRVIDLSQAAMKALGLRARGVVRVELLRE
ncbi:septal ring lytic transglycosylase RlpA family protein [Hydrogenophaga crassostreae]|nr:septal ring lytic transglycosylase RlpA family protein [Hydrogenophaga crassostreae]